MARTTSASRARACTFAGVLALACAGASTACSGSGGESASGDAPDGSPAPSSSESDGATATDSASAPDDAATTHDASAHDAAAHDASAGHDAEAGPACKKELTVVFSVGTGAGAVESHSNGCWTVVDADGAANHAFRKCSTSSFVVQNASATSFAYDDTNPTRPLSQDQSFLAQCASGATGTGFEYMAYRGGWRLLSAPHIDAYFAELYSSDQTVDDYYAQWQTSIGGHTVSPMINIGPNAPATIESSGLAMCKRVATHGWFGVYNAAWQQGMSASDPRAQAIAKALNACTAM